MAVRLLWRARFDQEKPRQYPQTVARKSAIRLRPGISTSGTALASKREHLRPRVAEHERADCYAIHSEENAVAKGKRTFQPNNRRRARVHGFRLRMRTRAGRAIVANRRAKGRRALTA